MWTEGSERYLRVKRLAHTAHENLALGLSELVRTESTMSGRRGERTVLSVPSQILNSRKGLFTRLAVKWALHLATHRGAWPFCGLHGERTCCEAMRCK
jgi:hypothetical protein